MEDQRELEDLKRIAPTLFGLEKRDPFVVPEGFFERFPHEVQAAIAGKRTVIAWPLWLRRLAIALPVIALLGGAWWYFGRNDQDPAIAELSTTPSLDDLNWSEEQDLLASIGEEDLPLLVGPDIELSEAELAAYLAHENVDLTELMIEP